mmetsp:Transcript_6621/g.11961  ORF Transcript_6621/g.11961 Transcript_6621/m.11961 type:complete len:95 (+) Transcript_6621:197-481(+)
MSSWDRHTKNSALSAMESARIQYIQRMIEVEFEQLDDNLNIRSEPFVISDSSSLLSLEIHTNHVHAAADWCCRNHIFARKRDILISNVSKTTTE